MISLIELDSKQSTHEIIEETRRLVKQLELRDSITLVFGSKAVCDQLVPSNVAEAIVLQILASTQTQALWSAYTQRALIHL